jgi:imidazolonepropionase-like amidohydrolase
MLSRTSLSALFAATLVVACGPWSLFAAEPDAGEPDNEDAMAFTNCRVITLNGPAIEKGVVIVRDGKIAEVGAADKVKLPEGMPTTDCEGGVLLPGFCHPATRIGARGTGGGGSSTTAPTKTVEQELNPWMEDSRQAAANGVTTVGILPGAGIVGGQGLAARTGASDVASMTRNKGAFLRVDVDSGPRFVSTFSKALATARKELDDQTKYEKDLAAWNVAKAKAVAEKKPAPKALAKPKISSSNKAYRQVLLGEMALLVYVDDSAEVRGLEQALSDERVRGEKLRLYVRPGGDANRAAPALADLGATCVVAAGYSTWTGSLDLYCPGTFYRESGCDVILISGSTRRDGLRAFRTELAKVVRAGFPRDAVLRAACVGGAELLGVEDQVGTIQAGRRADFQLFSGDPLAPTSNLRGVWIDGQRIEETP